MFKFIQSLFKKKPTVDRAEAIASAAMFLTETMAEVMVKTVYGLTHQGIAAMFRAAADHLIKGSESAETTVEQAGLLLMAKEITDMADRLETKQPH